MTTNEYAIAAYAVGLGLMLSYALALWLESRRLHRRQRNSGGAGCTRS